MHIFAQDKALGFGALTMDVSIMSVRHRPHPQKMEASHGKQ